MRLELLTLTLEDEKWVEMLSKQLFGDRDMDTITMDQLKDTIKKMQATEPDCSHWTFGGCVRSWGCRLI